MKKKFIFPIIIFAVFLIIIYMIFILSNKNFYNITITNNSNLSISNLTLKFKPGKNINENFNINPGETIKYSINTSEINGETSLVLLFKDESNNIHEEYINGYLEKNYTGKSKVLIDIDNNNKIYFSIK